MKFSSALPNLRASVVEVARQALRKHPATLLGALVLALLAVVGSFPTLAGLFTLQRGTALLAAAPSQPAQLANAVELLEQSRRWAANTPEVHRQLGRAYGLQGRTSEAVAALEQAQQLSPRSALVLRDLLGAYEAAGAPQRADELLRAHAIGPATMASIGGRDLLAGSYEAALAWYERAARNGFSSPAFTFQLALASTLAAPATASSSAAAALDLQSVGAQSRIDGRRFRLLLEKPEYGVTYGTPLGELADPAAGAVLAWSGSAVIAIEVEQPGLYEVRFRVQHTPVAPVELQFEHNFTPFGRATLAQADLSWSEVRFELPLTGRRHLLSITFLNDGIEGGVDRNAVFDWVELRRIDEAAHAAPGHL